MLSLPGNRFPQSQPKHILIQRHTRLQRFENPSFGSELVIWNGQLATTIFVQCSLALTMTTGAEHLPMICRAALTPDLGLTRV